MRALVLVCVAACGGSGGSGTVDAPPAIDAPTDTPTVHHLMYMLTEAPTALRVVDLDTGHVLHDVPLGANLIAEYLRISTDGKTAYFGTNANMIEILDVAAGNATPVTMSGEMFDLQLSPNGATLYAAWYGPFIGALKIDIASHSVTGMFTPPSGTQVKSLAVEPDGMVLVAGISHNDGSKVPVQFIAASTMVDDGAAMFGAACARPDEVVLTGDGRALALDRSCVRIFQVDLATMSTLGYVDLDPSLAASDEVGYSALAGRAYVMNRPTVDTGALYGVDLGAKTSTQLTGFSGPVSYYRLTDDGSALYAIANTTPGSGTPRTFDRYDTVTGTVTQGVYQLDAGQYVNDFLVRDFATLP